MNKSCLFCKVLLLRLELSLILTDLITKCNSFRDENTLYVARFLISVPAEISVPAKTGICRYTGPYRPRSRFFFSFFSSFLNRYNGFFYFILKLFCEMLF